MNVHILLEANERGNHIVGVFRSNAAAIAYAQKYKILSWHIQTHSVFSMKQVKKL